MWSSTVKLDEEKWNYAGLAQENGFRSGTFCDDWLKAQQSYTPAEKGVINMM